MNSRKPLVLIAAAVIAIIAVFILYQYVTGQKDAVYGNAELVPVYVVQPPGVKKGTYGQQTGSLIVKDKIPKKYYPSNAITKLDQITNKLAVADMPANTIVLDNSFVDPATASVSLSTQLKQIHGEDQVAVSIQVSSVQGVAGLIVPGDFVNIMVTKLSAINLASGDTGPASGSQGGSVANQACGDVVIPAGSSQGDFLFCNQARVMLQKVEVLAVGSNAIPQPGQEAASGSSATTQNANTGLLTFIVPMKYAQYIASVPDGHYYLTLTSKDYKPKATKPIKPNDPLPSEDPKILTPYGPSGPT